MAQTIGYLLAACGPPLIGKIRDAYGDWHIPLIIVALIAVVMALFGALAEGRAKFINPEEVRQPWLPIFLLPGRVRKACTSGAGRPSSALRSMLEQRGDEERMVVNSTARISPFSSQPVTRSAPLLQFMGKAFIMRRSYNDIPLQCYGP